MAAAAAAKVTRQINTTEHEGLIVAVTKLYTDAEGNWKGKRVRPDKDLSADEQ